MIYTSLYMYNTDNGVWVIALKGDAQAVNNF